MQGGMGIPTGLGDPTSPQRWAHQAGDNKRAAVTLGTQCVSTRDNLCVTENSPGDCKGFPKSYWHHATTWVQPCWGCVSQQHGSAIKQWKKSTPVCPHQLSNGQRGSTVFMSTFKLHFKPACEQLFNYLSSSVLRQKIYWAIPWNPWVRGKCFMHKVQAWSFQHGCQWKHVVTRQQSQQRQTASRFSAQRCCCKATCQCFLSLLPEVSAVSHCKAKNLAAGRAKLK